MSKKEQAIIAASIEREAVTPLSRKERTGLRAAVAKDPFVAYDFLVKREQYLNLPDFAKLKSAAEAALIEGLKNDSKLAKMPLPQMERMQEAEEAIKLVTRKWKGEEYRKNNK